MRHRIIPLGLGAAMALLMLSMLHARIMAGEGVGLMAAAAFVVAHLAVLAIGAALLLVVPALRRRVRAHRPSLGHVASMALGAIVTVILVHLVVHGSVA